MRLLHARPPSCKRPRVDGTEVDRALERHRALEIVDGMVAGGMRRGDAPRTIGLARSTYYDWRRAFRRGGVRALSPGARGPAPSAAGAGRTPTTGPCSGCGPNIRSWASSASRPCSTGAVSTSPSRPSDASWRRPSPMAASAPRPSARGSPGPKGGAASKRDGRGAGSTATGPGPPARWSKSTT